MVITDETIEYVGILAKLELSDEEKEQSKKEKSIRKLHFGKSRKRPETLLTS